MYTENMEGEHVQDSNITGSHGCEYEDDSLSDMMLCYWLLLRGSIIQSIPCNCDRFTDLLYSPSEF
jgi:hypothetical protein